jgi:HrpA-like RNA helicase
MASLLKRDLQEDKDNLKHSIMGNGGNGSAGVDIVQQLHGLGTDLTSSKVASIINGVMVCVLYAALPPEAQMMAFAPKPKGCSRKIILSTNIAETSGECGFCVCFLWVA